MHKIMTGDGSYTLFSDQYGVPYHSRYGAVTESTHVYIASGLRYKAVMQREISILEIGLGTGLNAIMTFLEAEKRGLTVEYTGIEICPPSLELAKSLHFMDYLKLPEREEGFLDIHKSDWGRRHNFSELFAFSKHLVSIQAYTPANKFDLIYFDAFAPQAQPELWTAEIFAKMFDALNPEGILVTYCAKGEFKRCLKKTGFTVETLKGPPGKREMTRGEKVG